MTGVGVWPTRITVIGAVMAVLLASMGPATAQEAGQARAEAYGAEITGAVDLGPLPDPPATAEVPPGEEDSDSFLEVPAEPLVFSGTLSGNVEASRQANIEAKLQGIMDSASTASLPDAWNSRGHAITEDLGVLFAGEGGDLVIPEELTDLVDQILGDGGGEDPVGSLEQPDDGQDPIGDEDPTGGAEPVGDEDPVGGEDPTGGEDPVSGQEAVEDQAPETAQTQQQEEAPLITAEVVESEAVAQCDGTDSVFATGSRVQQLQLSGETFPVLGDILGTATELVVQGEPNEDVLANLDAAGDLLKELGLEITAWETNWDGADGTTDGSDTVWVNALHVSVTEGSPLGDAVGAQDVVISHSEASVAQCGAGVGPEEEPLQNVSKDSSVETVAPGDTFTYTITIPNSDPSCTLENVEVVDTITGPSGSEITGTNPPADNVDNLTATWNDVGPIAPGDQVTLTIDVLVPSDAQGGETYSENVGVTADCDGESVEGGTDFDGPEVAHVKPGGSQQPTSGELPETGGGAALVGMLLLGGGLMAAQLRRRLT